LLSKILDFLLSFDTKNTDKSLQKLIDLMDSLDDVLVDEKECREVGPAFYNCAVEMKNTRIHTTSETLFCAYCKYLLISATYWV
jgi:hypothetical protein